MVKIIFVFLYMLSCVNADWEQLHSLLARQKFVASNFAVTVGRRREILYHFEKQTEKGNTYASDEKRLVASASKLVSGTMLLKMIEDGYFDFEDYVADYLNFWTKSPFDPRSRLKIKHCLSFTTGFKVGLTILPWCVAGKTFQQCLRQHYNELGAQEEPGTIFDYNEFNLNIVGAVAEVAAGRPIGELLAEFLQSNNMTDSNYVGTRDSHILLGGSLRTTTNDYVQFLMRHHNEEIVNANTLDLMFSDYTQRRDGVMVSSFSHSQFFSLGHYGYANWYECPYHIVRGYPRTPQKCIDDEVHASLGAFGWYPIFDRRLDYWLLISNQKFSSYGSHCLRMLIKEFINEAVLRVSSPDITEIDDAYYNSMDHEIEALYDHEPETNFYQKYFDDMGIDAFGAE